ncbi:protein phosphatase 2C domain-containing protein [Phytohabitans houttuyneae]|uniref:PPM-type phosphatase domain-containing protein n=1 Tax=Phytohabitans houttuyneae TaxID=1076126 RepID=A0A6V8K3A3_9ACTN|nr:protein phosphatase 2C domain-containing protein [Phytohabitans houttuyneae]GFJ76277.1 hypothetical protein Phou_004570 [Phytohabitans houttuyneae]
MAEAAQGASTATVTVIVVAATCILLAFAALAKARTRSANVQHLKVGEEVTATGRARRPAGGGERLRDEPVRAPRRPRLPRWARLPWRSGAAATPASEGDVRPMVLSERSRGPVEPKLVAPVLTAGVWGRAVDHGACEARGGRFVVRAAAMRGASHAFDGVPGDDAAGVVWNQRRESLLVAVADGLGSMVDSGYVARWVVGHAMDQGERLDPGDDVEHMLDRVTGQLADHMVAQDVDGATTLVLAEVRPAAGGAVVTTWGVGDSEAWVLHGGGWHALHHERRGDAENVTRQLPRHRLKRGRPQRLPAGAVLVLASDGFAGALGGDGSPLARELAGRWKAPPSPVEYLAQVDFVDDYWTDDRAVVAVWIR